MKLSTDQIDSIERKTGFKPIPEDAAKESGLTASLGDHTFYVDPNGLYMFEPVQDSAAAVVAIQLAEIERREGTQDEVVVSAIDPQRTSLEVDLAD